MGPFMKSYWSMIAALTIILVWNGLLIWTGCYKCKTPDCSELPPGGDYPNEQVSKRVIDAGGERGKRP